MALRIAGHSCGMLRAAVLVTVAERTWTEGGFLLRASADAKTIEAQQKDSHGRLLCGVSAAAAACFAASRRTRTLMRSDAAQPSGSNTRSLLKSRVQIIGSCCFIIMQYALLQIFGIYSSELLEPGDANQLYAAANWGACFLAAPAGIVFDVLGPAWACLLGGLCGSLGLSLAAASLLGTPQLYGAMAGYFIFGFGATLLNTVAVLAAVRAAPAKQSAKVSAGVLCSLALGMSFHTAVHAQWFRGAPFNFLTYQIAYSLISGILGFLVFRSSSWTAVVESAADSSNSQESQDPQPNSTAVRIWNIVRAKEFPWLAALHLIPIAYSFAWLGSWSVCAEKLLIPEEDRTRIGLGLGLFSAAGRILFGLIGDWSPGGRGRIGLELGFVGSVGLFQLAFMLLEHDQRTFFELAMQLQCLGYGGLLCLAPVALRAGFAVEDLGTSFGLLYQLLAVTFTVFNWAAVPGVDCIGSECFRSFFSVSSILNACCLLWALTRLARASQKVAPPSLRAQKL